MSGVVPLDKADDRALFGGKAANLASLIQGGFPVPGGVAVAVTAFDDERLEAKAGQKLQNWLKQQSPKKKYAVRSSAMQEDGSEKSWAGQFETFLNVLAKDVPDKIIECHEAVGERAQAYSGVGASRLEVAVVVQEMINPDYAGVMFTRNPVDGSDQVVIEYMAGLADQLVSGQVTPETAVWDRQSQKLEVDHNPPFDIQKIVDQGLAIEEHYSTPQDIEWAVAEGNIYIVQSRSITTLNGA